MLDAVLVLGFELEMVVFQFGVVDVAQIDAVLVSNFTTMLALPYLTHCTHFRGKIYATEPTLQIGRYFF
jgi:integrator complex subunit 9